MGDRMQWCDSGADNPPWINALADLRQRATREGYRLEHAAAAQLCESFKKRRLFCPLPPNKRYR